MRILKSSKILFKSVVLIIIAFMLIAGCAKKKGDIPNINDIPKEKQGAGDVWIEPAEQTVTAGSSFTNTVHVNSGSQNLAAYGIKVIYDNKILAVDTEKGNSGAVEGPDGFVQAVNPNVKNVLTIGGFDVGGKGPAADLNVMTLYWKAIKAGSVDMIIQVMNLVDNAYNPVGKPTGYAAKIIVNEAS